MGTFNGSCLQKGGSSWSQTMEAATFGSREAIRPSGRDHSHEQHPASCHTVCETEAITVWVQVRAQGTAAKRLIFHTAPPLDSLVLNCWAVVHMTSGVYLREVHCMTTLKKLALHEYLPTATESCGGLTCFLTLFAYACKRRLQADFVPRVSVDMFGLSLDGVLNNIHTDVAHNARTSTPEGLMLWS